MAKKKYLPEEGVTKQCQVDVLNSQGEYVNGGCDPIDRCKSDHLLPLDQGDFRGRQEASDWG